MPLPQISFVNRNQILIWVSDPKSKARIRGIMVLMSCYLDDIKTAEALSVYEQAETQLGTEFQNAPPDRSDFEKRDYGKRDAVHLGPYDRVFPSRSLRPLHPPPALFHRHEDHDGHVYQCVLVRGWLGEVEVGGGARRAGTISRYLVERYGFDPETSVTSFTNDALAAYLSLAPQPSDAVLQFGPMDVMMAPAAHYIPTKLYQLFPHPAQDPSEKRRYVAALTIRNADVPRARARHVHQELERV
ncbi:hypothetical protein K438DRAFT_1966919 [Mycena galopus ATCC 62051]|nr:hypothetical protein K438DRAFT_1966919 [Mycena galopus ATCC 62051]